jgi:hypothetical protein
MFTKNLPIAFAALLALAAGATPGWAADTARVRGTVAGIEGPMLSVKTREGDTAAIKLTEGWQISGVKAASIGDIKPGDFLGIASVPRADGGDGALEVVIFPAAMKGAGEGSRPWDLQPNSSMTNGTVEEAVSQVDGRTVTLSYHGQQRKIAIPDNVPVVTFAPATEADVKPGAPVFVFAERGADGALTANRVVVGNNGVAPPM